MKTKLTITLLTLSLFSYSESRKCNIERFVDPITKKSSQVIFSPTDAGKLLVGRSADGYILGYVSERPISYGSDSDLIGIVKVRYTFSDSTAIVLRGRGISSLSNRVELRPALNDIYFVVDITAKQASQFKTKKVTSLSVKDEKERETSPNFSAKNQSDLANSFDCFNKR